MNPSLIETLLGAAAIAMVAAQIGTMISVARLSVHMQYMRDKLETLDKEPDQCDAHSRTHPSLASHPAR